jgi:hypothetical protein
VSSYFGDTTLAIDPPPEPVRGRPTIAIRDLEWLSGFCCTETSAPEKLSLARELCAIAAGRFCESWPAGSGEVRYSRREDPLPGASLQLLVKALLANRSDKDLSRVIGFVRNSAQFFSLGGWQVPCLQSIVPWSRKRFGAVHPLLEAWLASVRQQLQSATEKRPAPPSNWARPATVNCTCRYCAPLKAFLSDPAQEVGRIAAREDARQHLIGIISRHQCDVQYALERKGSPYSLLLTKTNGSFERAVKRFEDDRRLLSQLNSTAR